MIVALRMVYRALLCRRTRDLAEPRGSTSPAVLYSLTAAMAPWKKESARLHPGIYTLGVVYHMGIFLGFLWLVMLFAGLRLPELVIDPATVIFACAALCGIVLLARRVASADLRYISGPDDYFSNCFVTGFLVLAALSLQHPGTVKAFFVYAGLVFLYIPVGKLRHAIYFVPARLYLGLFYGRRGVWPANRKGAGRA
jgi:hypothetical protein